MDSDAADAKIFIAAICACSLIVGGAIAAALWQRHMRLELYSECIRLHSPDACKDVAP